MTATRRREHDAATPSHTSLVPKACLRHEMLNAAPSLVGVAAATAVAFVHVPRVLFWGCR